MTDAITSISRASDVLATGDPTATAATSLGKDDFLKLLVAQMKYQDPSSPTDSSQFLAQSAQFSLVEKFAEVAKIEQQLLDASQVQSATSMVGRAITWTTSSGATKTGTVSAVSITAGTPTLMVDGTKVDLESVTQVEPAKAT